MNYIWQSKNYPNFKYNHIELNSLIENIQENETTLKNILNIDKNEEINLKIDTLTKEIMNSSLIEGELLRRDSVRSSLQKKLDKNFDNLSDKKATRQTDNLASLLLDTNLNKAPLTKQRLHGWHNALFEDGYSGLYKINVAKFRDNEMQVISGKIGHENIIYEALPKIDIEQNIENFLKYCNESSENAYIKSSIAHLWFVIIHPYDDGNGRISRAIADYILPNEDIKLYSISSEIMANRKEYYEILEKTTKNNENCDITDWLKWHLSIINEALKNGIKQITNVLYKAKFWDNYKDKLNERQTKAINKILDIGISDFDGFLTTRKYLSLAKLNKNDINLAHQDLNELVELGCLLTTAKEGKFKFCNLDITKINKKT